MSKPNLYQEPGNNNLISVHDFAKMNGYSIRKARRIIGKMIRNGELVIFRLCKRNK